MSVSADLDTKDSYPYPRIFISNDPAHHYYFDDPTGHPRDVKELIVQAWIAQVVERSTSKLGIVQIPIQALNFSLSHNISFNMIIYLQRQLAIIVERL